MSAKYVELDVTAGWIDIKIGKKCDPPAVRGLQPRGPIQATAARASIAATGKLALTGGKNLATRVLTRRVPSALPVRADESPADALIRIGTSLDGEVLAVQGPPGTGKTFNAAKLIRGLLDQGKKVGITANSHTVIGGLLREIGLPALQKATEEQWCKAPAVAWTNDFKKVDAAVNDGTHQLIAGTAWLWAREELDDAVDVLVVDEAGQFSLANAVAVARAAKSLVLLGDPQQLTQPTQAEHPYGAGVSVLEYMLDGHPTIPWDLGIFSTAPGGCTRP